MKLSILKVANAIPCGPRTEHVFQEAEYDIEESESFKLKITHKKTSVSVNTSYFNAVYWKYSNAINEVALGSKPSESRTRSSAKTKEL